MIEITPFLVTGKEWKIDPGNLVDQLSVYLALSIDIQKTPDQVEFVYQVAEEDGVEYQKFLVKGYQNRYYSRQRD